MVEGFRPCPFDLYELFTNEVPVAKQDGIAYLVGENGAFCRVSTPFFDAIVPAKTLPMLYAVQPGATLKLPRMPAVQTAQIIAFFRAVWERFAAEAILIIAFNAETQEYRFVAPPQTVSGGKCDYDMPRKDVVPPGFTHIGTVHSHGSLNAFHSGTDEHDEANFDGVHATVGLLDAYHPQIVASLAFGTNRFPLDPTLFFGGVRAVAPAGSLPCIPSADALAALERSLVEEFGAEHFAAFLNANKLESLAAIFAKFGGVNGTNGEKDGHGSGGDTRHASRYAIDPPNGTLLSATTFDPAWLDVVRPFRLKQIEDGLRDHLRGKGVPPAAGSRKGRRPPKSARMQERLARAQQAAEALAAASTPEEADAAPEEEPVVGQENAD